MKFKWLQWDSNPQPLSCKWTLNHLAKPVWLNGWVFIYKLSGCGFKSCCSHLNRALKFPKSKFSVSTEPCNMVILILLKANTNLQHVTGIFAMLTYLTSDLCKPDHHMSELMKKPSKDAYKKNVKGKICCIDNIFLIKLKVLIHEAI